MAEKYKTCQHSTGNVGELIVYVRPGCPRLSIINGVMCSSKVRCKKCISYKAVDDLEKTDVIQGFSRDSTRAAERRTKCIKTKKVITTVPREPRYARADKQPEEVDWMVKMFREVAEKLGYEIANRIAFRDRRTGRKWE